MFTSSWHIFIFLYLSHCCMHLLCSIILTASWFLTSTISQTIVSFHSSLNPHPLSASEQSNFTSNCMQFWWKVISNCVSLHRFYLAFWLFAAISFYFRFLMFTVFYLYVHILRFSFPFVLQYSKWIWPGQWYFVRSIFYCTAFQSLRVYIIYPTVVVTCSLQNDKQPFAHTSEDNVMQTQNKMP